MTALDWSTPFARLEQGQKFRSRGRTITETDLVSFAALTGDRHPQHTDVHWSAKSRFGERIAHGMLILSYAVGLVPFDPERVVALRRIQDVVFKRPATLGDTIHVNGKIIQLNELTKHAGLVRWRWEVRNSNEQLLCRAQLETLWATEHPPPGDQDRAIIEFPPGVLPC